MAVALEWTILFQDTTRAPEDWILAIAARMPEAEHLTPTSLSLPGKVLVDSQVQHLSPRERRTIVSISQEPDDNFEYDEDAHEQVGKAVLSFLLREVSCDLEVRVGEHAYELQFARRNGRLLADRHRAGVWLEVSEGMGQLELLETVPE